MPYQPWMSLRLLDVRNKEPLSACLFLLLFFGLSFCSVSFMNYRPAVIKKDMYSAVHFKEQGRICWVINSPLWHIAYSEFRVRSVAAHARAAATECINWWSVETWLRNVVFAIGHCLTMCGGFFFCVESPFYFSTLNHLCFHSGSRISLLALFKADEYFSFVSTLYYSISVMFIQRKHKNPYNRKFRLFFS